MRTTPAFSFPATAGSGAVDPRPRVESGALNLKSCELLHPDSDRLVAEALAGLDVRDVRSYPYQARTLAALAAHHGVDERAITLTAGSDHAIGLIVDAFARPAGRLVLAAPAFESWTEYARLREVPVTEAPVIAGSPPRADLSALRAAMAAAPGPSVVALANPVSPAGLVLPLDEIADLVALAERHGHLLVVDECYGAFAGLTHVPLLAGHPHLVVVRSCSKAFALAGGRLATVLADPEAGGRVFRYRSDSTVSGPALALLGALVARADEFAAVWRDVEAIRDGFAADVLARHPGWTCPTTGGNYATFVTGDPVLPDRIAAGLAERGVRIRSLTALTGLSGAFRVSLADRATMARVVDLIGEVCDQLG